MTGLQMLIAEDDDILGMNLAAAAEDRGCHVVATVGTVAEAIAKLKNADVGGAVLDASLLDRDVTPVAMELIRRAIPFVIHTGVGLPKEIASVFPHVSVIMKPADPDLVVLQLLAQVQALNDRKALGEDDGLSSEGGRIVRENQIQRIASALRKQFGNMAVVLARRQAEDAKGDALVTWTSIVEALSESDSTTQH
jgi:ActR/RegA family two-component response regulator